MVRRKQNVNYFNEYKINSDGTCEFYITNRKKETFTVLLDRDILDELIEFNRPWNAKWQANSKSYYACCNEYLGVDSTGRRLYNIHYLNRWIMKAKEGEYVDHIQQKETLDNRRQNLRITTNSKNGQHRKGKNINNKSGYRNVCWDKGGKKWKVQLHIEGKNTILGYFDDVHEAGVFAEKMRKAHYGKFKGDS